MKRLLIILSLVGPTVLLVGLALFPEWDITFHNPLFHFYVVTFITFAAAVVSFFIAYTLHQAGLSRYQLLPTAFAAMAGIFLIHGLYTPQAIFFTSNPGVRWAAWLTLFIGGIVFMLATFHPSPRMIRTVNLSLVLAIGFFAGIVILVPHWLTYIDENVAPFHRWLAFSSTFLAWLIAMLRLGQQWRQTGERMAGVMALIAAWQLIGTVSLHQFPLWHLSWWLYHTQLLMGVLLAVGALVQEHERLRQFSLTRYFAVTSLIVMGALALLAAHLFSQFVEQELGRVLAEVGVDTMAAGHGGMGAEGERMVSAAATITRARLVGLLIGGSSMGLLFLALLGIVRRADHLISQRTQELAQAYHHLRAAEAVRDDLTNMIVHDLRTPLTTVIMGLEWLQKAEDEPQARSNRQRFLQTAAASADRLIRLINDLLDVTRLEAGRLQPNYAPTDLNKLLHSRAAAYSPLAEGEEKQILVQAETQLPLVSADQTLLERVLENLIGNALKYTQAGGQVILAAQQQGDQALLSVTDDGEGIPLVYQSRIFDKFVQVTREDGQPIRKGSGLGLAFCRLVVEAHGGNIWVASEPDQGSTFFFTLPLTRP
ncbi:MAG: hypothetical protein KJ063_00210 [Anaerolineae bacterium]|nr:hypothetical protein [Anaerolineae bacterium]